MARASPLRGAQRPEGPAFANPQIPTQALPGCMRAWPLALLAVVLAVPSAAAQDPWIYFGGEPGVRITAAQIAIEGAASPATAIVVDPALPIDLSISISPPANRTWDIRSFSVGLLVNGPGSAPPEALLRRSETNSSLPPGWTVVMNRSIELGALQRAGAGTFLMQAEILDANGSQLYAQSFYVRVPVGPAQLLTVQGATITAVSVATGYGFWQVAKDAKELRDAWERHRKKQQLAKLDVYGRAEHAIEAVVEKGGKPLASAVDLHRTIQSSEKGLSPIRWTATGLGLGGVLIAWLQFLGYIAFDAIGMVVTALEGAAIFLTLALLANALLKRAKAKAAASALAPPAEEPVRSLMPADAQTGAPQVELPHDGGPAVEPAPEVVHPVDKRG